MSKPFRGTINVDIRDSEPGWAPFEPPKAPDGVRFTQWHTAALCSPACSCLLTGRMTQPGNFELAGEGLCVRDSGAEVTGGCPGTRPYRFTGRVIKRVAVDASGQPCLDLECEAEAMLARE